MADNVRFTAEFDDRGIERALNRVINEIDKTGDAFKDLERTAKKSFNNAEKESRSLEQQIKDQKDETKLLEKEILRLESIYVRLGNSGSASGKRISKQLKVLRNDLKQSRFQTKELEAEFKKAGKGVGAFGKISDSVFDGIEQGGGKAGSAIAGIARTAGPVGAAVAAGLGLIVAAFLDVEENADKAKDAIIGIKAAANQLKTDTFTAIRLSFNALRGDFAGIATELSKLFDPAKRTIGEAFNQGEDFAVLQRNLKKQNELSLSTEVKRTEEAKKFAELAGDQNKQLSERVGLLRAAASAESDINQQQIIRLTNELAEIRRKNDVFGKQEGSLEAISAIENEIATLQGQNNVASIQANQQINALLQERLERTKKITDQLREANATLGGPAEVAKAQYEAATEAIQQLREEASLLGLDVDFGPLETIAKAQFERATDAARGELERLPEEVDRILSEVSIAFQGADFIQEGSEAGARLGAAYAEGVKINAIPIIEEISLGIQEAFGINEDQFNVLIGSLGTAYSGLTDGILANTERQIAAQDRIVQATRQRVDQITLLLEAEKEKAADGYAENVASYQKQLEEQQAIQEQAENKRLDLEKKAANQRLLINAAEQASNLVLAAAKLTAAEAGKGIIGIGLALAGLATIFSIVNQAKANAEQFKEIPRFRTGTDFVHGPGSGQSDSVLSFLSRGERVVDASNNARIPRGTTNDHLVQMFSVGKAYTDHLKYERVDVAGMVQKVLADQQAIGRLEMERQTATMKTAYERAAMKAAETTIEYWKTRPFEWVDSDGSTVYERHDGGRIQRRRIKTK